MGSAIDELIDTPLIAAFKGLIYGRSLMVVCGLGGSLFIGVAELVVKQG